MFLAGYDPEIFWKMKGSDKIISVIGKLGGTKDQARIVSADGHGVLEDNVAAEFNGPPASNLKDFKHNINFMVDFINKAAEQYGCEVAKGVASASLSDDQLKDRAAHVFGCEPDYNAWLEGERNQQPHCNDPNFRCAGGHIHIGTEEQNKLYLIKKMDLFLGVPSVLMDLDTDRRKLYGKAGAFRPKPYGAEYRTLSNFWIWEDKYIDWAYTQTKRAVESDIDEDTLDHLSLFIQTAINQSDRTTATSLCAGFDLAVV